MSSETEKLKKNNLKINLQEMTEAGLHFGHRTTRLHPKMMPYILGVRNTVHIIDLKKTKEKLENALEFIRKLISDNKVLLIVGTKIQAKDLVKKLAEDYHLPYITERWIGGTFTNFNVIKKRIDYLKELENKKRDGLFEKYTKKERVKIDEEIKDLEVKFGGIKNMEKLPDAIFVLDMRKDELAVKEAKMKGVKIIGVADTNVDPTMADYPIPANDDAISSIRYILDRVRDVIEKARTETKKTKKQETK